MLLMLVLNAKLSDLSILAHLVLSLMVFAEFIMARNQ